MSVPPAAAAHTADQVDAVEDTPLLHESRASPESDESWTPNDRRMGPSAFEVLARNSFTGATGWAAQIGLVVATVVLWRVLWAHPAGA